MLSFYTHGACVEIFSHRFVLNDSASPRFRPSRCLKSDASKCTEQSTDVFDGCQSARSLRTKRTHLSRIASSRGNMCIDAPSVLELFVQLTYPGSPATQYLPEILSFGFSTYAHSGFTQSTEMYTTSDVTRLFWPRQDGRQF